MFELRGERDLVGSGIGLGLMMLFLRLPPRRGSLFLSDVLDCLSDTDGMDESEWCEWGEENGREGRGREGVEGLLIGHGGRAGEAVPKFKNLMVGMEHIGHPPRRVMGWNRFGLFWGRGYARSILEVNLTKIELERRKGNLDID